MNETIHESLTDLATVGWTGSLACELLQDQHLAADAKQQAILVALQKGHEAKGPLAAWFSGVLRNKAREARRKATTRRRIEKKGARAEQVPSSAEIASRFEEQKLLADAVLRLSPIYRDVVYLRFYEELPQREIAARLDIPVATVNTRLHRAYAELRESLDRSHGGNRSAWVTAFIPLAAEWRTPSLLKVGALIMQSKWFQAAALSAIFFTAIRLIPSESVDESLPTSGVVAPNEKGAEIVRRSSPSRVSSADSLATILGAIESEAALAPQMLRRMRVKTIDLKTGQPLAGVDVWVQDERDSVAESPKRSAWRVRREIDGQSRFDQLKTFAKKFTTGADGLAIVEMSELGASILAQKGELCDVVSVGSGRQSEVVLEVGAPRFLRVLVNDAAGVPVAGIVASMTFPERNASGSDSRKTQCAATAADGIATFTLVESEYESLHDGRAKAYFSVNGAFGRAERTLLEPSAFEGGVYETKLPPTAKVEVLIADPSGRPVEDGRVVRLASEFATAEASKVPTPWPAVALTKNGKASFSRVALGQKLRVRFALTDDGVTTSTTFDGPKKTEETTTFEWKVDGKLRTVKASFVDKDKKPLSGRFISVQIYRSGERKGTPETQVHITDADGAIAAIVPEYATGKFAGPIVFVPIPQSRHMEIAPAFIAPSETGVIDFGRLTIEDPIPDVAGHVSDAAGRPVPFAKVTLEAIESIEVIGRTSDVERRIASTVADENGRFEIFIGRRESPNGPLFVVARGFGRFADTKVAVGAKKSDVVIAYAAAGLIEGRIVGLDSEDLSKATVTALKSKTSQSGRVFNSPDREKIKIDRRGWFTIGGLEAGSYDVTVAKGQSRIAVVEGVQVKLGETTKDPRLLPCTIAEKAQGRVVTIRAVDSMGATIIADVNLAGGKTAFTATFGGGRRLGPTGRSLNMAAADLGGKLMISAPGYFPVEIAVPEKETTVVLSSGIVVELLWKGAALPEAPRVVDVQLDVIAAGLPIFRSASGEVGTSTVFDKSGRARIRVPAAGKQKLFIRPGIAGAATSVRGFDGEPTLKTVEIDVAKDQKEPITIEVDISTFPSGWEALEKFRR